MFYNRDALGQGITQAGSALGSALGQRGMQQQQLALQEQLRGRQTNTQNLMMEAIRNSQGGDVLDALSGIDLTNKNIDPATFNSILEKVIGEKAKGQYTPRTPAKTTAPQPSPFEKKLGEKTADWVFNQVEAGRGIGERSDLINQLTKLTEANTGPTGYINFEKAAEINSLGFLALEPALKVFNPSGQISQEKLKLLADKMSIKASDTQWTTTGKLNAYKFLNQQEMMHQQKFDKLLEKYPDGNIPINELNKINSEGIKFLNNVEKEVDKVIKSEEKQGKADESTEHKEQNLTVGMKIQKPSNAQAKHQTGKIIYNKKTGEKLISDGNKWIKY